MSIHKIPGKISLVGKEKEESDKRVVEKNHVSLTVVRKMELMNQHQAARIVYFSWEKNEIFMGVE